MDEDLSVDFEDPNFKNRLEFAMVATMGSSAYRNDRERPYNGQPWTDYGTRGRTEVLGLTMRDVKDCIIQGFLAASGNRDLQAKTFPLDKEEGQTSDWRPEDLYQIEGHDPMAVIQNALCFIESYMGIFPNIERPIVLEDILGDPGTP